MKTITALASVLMITSSVNAILTADWSLKWSHD